MTENPEARLGARGCAAIVEAQANIVAMIAGHLHRPIVTRWAGTTLAVCPATAPQVALDLEPMDPEAPDGRPMIVADQPWFALHYWNGERPDHPFRHRRGARGPRPLHPRAPAPAAHAQEGAGEGSERSVSFSRR